MRERNNLVCPVAIAASLDNRLRRWLQDPRKILGPYIKEGMTVLDFGCGPGYFTMDMAQMVGESGRVIAADLQEGMLQKLAKKIKGTGLERRITLHQCEKNHIGLSERVDFVLAFYMVHEIRNQEELFNQIASLLKPNGQLFIVEPPFHVSKKAFQETLTKARDAGLRPVQRPKILLSRAAILEHGPQ